MKKYLKMGSAVLLILAGLVAMTACQSTIETKLNANDTESSQKISSVISEITTAATADTEPSETDPAASNPADTTSGGTVHFDPETVTPDNPNNGYKLTENLDMDGDGKLESIRVDPVALESDPQHVDKYIIYFNGEELSSLYVADAFCFGGIDVIDIDNSDTFKEVVCSFDIASEDYVAYIIRFDGISVKFQKTALLYDAPGDGSLLVGEGEFLQSGDATKEYSVDDQFNFTWVNRLYDTDMNVISKVPVQVQFMKDGIYTDGILETGTKICIYQVDYVSKAYFRTSDGREGLLMVNGLTIEPDGIFSQECFDGFAFGD